MATLAEINKALDTLDPLALDEESVARWAQEQIALAKGDNGHLAHIREQITEAQKVFGSGSASFRVKAYKLADPTPLAAASAKLGEALAGKSGTEADATASKTDDENTEDADDKGTDDPEPTPEPAAKGKIRKAAPETVGKGYYAVESDADAKDVFGSGLGASMAKIKLGPDGNLYVRD